MTRKKQFLIVTTLLVSIQLSFGQKTEVNINAYNGLFSFRGKGSTSTSSMITIPYYVPYIFTSNPYGKKSEFSYAFELQGQRVTKNKIIYGIGIGFETLTSKVNINSTIVTDILNGKSAAVGKTKLENNFLTLNPFFGHRYSYRKISFDLLAGIDLAFCLKSKEVGNALTSGGFYETVENERAKPSIDFRPGIKIKTQINKFGFLAGYSLGLTNYQTPNNSKAYTSFLRLGLGYQLK